MSEFSPLILGMGGTARPNSTSEKSVRVALAAAEKMGARTILIDGPHLARLPLYAPDRADRTEDEIALIEAARACDGIIVATPGYHGSLSGPIKNALDMLEDTSRDDRVYLDGCAFGAIAHALRAWPTPYGAALNASTPLFESDGSCIDSKVEAQLEIVAQQVVDFARWRHAGLNK
jgi:FMN reductase